MCGFVVAFNKRKDRSIDPDSMRAMLNQIAHRGPDHSQVFATESVGMGFARLSILDLSERANQPLFDASHRYAIVHNGEIYNYADLRNELKALGREFVTDGDTEVVLQAYLQWGEDCIRRFRGMFASVIVDLVDGEARVFRDPFGIKPLYCFENDEALIFTSEVKALLPCFRLEADRSAFYEYLVFRYTFGERTLFRDVKTVLPGSRLTVRRARVVNNDRYERIEDRWRAPKRESSESDCIEETDRLLNESVAAHLRSDVPLGTALSGGVDSSLLTAMTSKKVCGDLHTFSIQLDVEGLDESGFQQRVSQRYQTVHHGYDFDQQRFLELWQKAVWHLDFPLNHSNSVALLELSRLMKQHITVLLTGEGADELFRGYGRYARLTPSARHRIKNWVKERLSRRSARRTLGNELAGNPAVFLTSFAAPSRVSQVCPSLEKNLNARMQLVDSVPGDEMVKAVAVDYLGYLHSLLERQDKMSMAHGIETRVPFCDLPLVDPLVHLPNERYVRGSQTKYLLKRVADAYLPDEVIYRNKCGFGLPLKTWWKNRNGFGGYESMFFDPTTLGRGVFDVRALRELLKEQSTDRTNHTGGLIWTLLNLEIWHRLFIDARPSRSLTRAVRSEKAAVN